MNFNNLRNDEPQVVSVNLNDKSIIENIFSKALNDNKSPEHTTLCQSMNNPIIRHMDFHGLTRRCLPTGAAKIPKQWTGSVSH